MKIRLYWNHWCFYIRKHGFLKCGRLALLRFWRNTFARSEWMYSVDLRTAQLGVSDDRIGHGLKAFAKTQDIDEMSIGQLRRFKSEIELKRFLDPYFAKGATLWLAKRGDEVTAVLWTLPRGFNGFYSLPISSNEVIILAVEVFPAYRGQGLFPQIATSLFQVLKSMGYSRAYLKVGGWNRSMQRSMEKTQCTVLGKVFTFSLGHSALTVWRHTNHDRSASGIRQETRKERH